MNYPPLPTCNYPWDILARNQHIHSDERILRNAPAQVPYNGSGAKIFAVILDGYRIEVKCARATETRLSETEIKSAAA